MQRMNTYLLLIQPQSYRVPRKQPSGWQLRTTKQSSHIKAHINRYNCVCLYINSTLVDSHEAARSKQVFLLFSCFAPLLHFCSSLISRNQQIQVWQLRFRRCQFTASIVHLRICEQQQKKNKVLCCVIPGPLLWKDNLLSNCNQSRISS